MPGFKSNLSKSLDAIGLLPVILNTVFPGVMLMA
jgi:hypothetical protein